MAASTFVPKTAEEQSILKEHTDRVARYQTVLTDGNDNKNWSSYDGHVACIDRVKEINRDFTAACDAIFTEMTTLFITTKTTLSDIQRRGTREKLALAVNRMNLMSGKPREILREMRDLISTHTFGRKDKLLDLGMLTIAAINLSLSDDGVKNKKGIGRLNDAALKNLATQDAAEKAAAAQRESKGTAVSGSHAAVANQLPPVVSGTNGIKSAPVSPVATKKADGNKTVVPSSAPVQPKQERKGPPSPKGSSTAQQHSFTHNMNKQPPAQTPLPPPAQQTTAANKTTFSPAH